MNGSLASIKEIIERLNTSDLPTSVDVVICPPAPYLLYSNTINQKAPQVEVGAQNVYLKPKGAYTGEISVENLKDVGINYVILGHSERRSIFHELSEFVAEKTQFALENGLKVILCIGETLEQKNNGETLKVVSEQLKAVTALVKDWSNIVIAYEPVWAIGTGLTATPQDAEDIHKEIRDFLKTEIGEKQAEEIRILYGGSVNGKNATSFKDKQNIDGFLVGGASLKPEFIDIINSRN